MRIRPPSPALVVALLALVAAMGGSAIAASFITSAQIKDGSVQAKDLSAKARASLRGKPGARGLIGPAGPAGPAGQAGSAGARGPSEVFEFTHRTAIALPNTATPLSAPLPAGSYVILAKLQVSNDDNANSARPFCTLTAGLDTDTGEPGTSNNTTSDDTAVATLTLTHTFSAPGTVTLECTDGGALTISLEDVRITAIQVATVTTKAI